MIYNEKITWFKRASNLRWYQCSPSQSYEIKREPAQATRTMVYPLNIFAQFVNRRAGELHFWGYTITTFNYISKASWYNKRLQIGSSLDLIKLHDGDQGFRFNRNILNVNRQLIAWKYFLEHHPCLPSAEY